MLWVIKLGGSLAKTSALKNWLYSLTELSKLNNIKIVIVPGGGPFADQVRDAQSHWKFDDTTAHQMALLAMEQYGLMMKGICPQVKLAKSLTSIEKILKTDNVCVWLPYQMVCNDKTIPESWDMTSDSLSAWFANLLQVDKLLLVKSMKPDEKIMNIKNITNNGWVDPLFAEIVQRDNYQTYLLYKDDYESIKKVSQNQPIGTLISYD